MFKCQKFNLKKSGLANFFDLRIPCDNYIIISLVESDTLNNDGVGMRVPCFMEGEQGLDFIIPGGDISKFGSVVHDVLSYLSKIPALSANPQF